MGDKSFLVPFANLDVEAVQSDLFLASFFSL